jgi:peptide/nickel transport system ATP-binding protein
MAPHDGLTSSVDQMAAIPMLMPDRPEVLLHVRGLSVSYGRRQVVTDVEFELLRGESLSLIGASGSGKSTIARSVLRLLPIDAGATGRVEFNGTDILILSERRFRRFRGRQIGFVPQDPGNALNPVRTIGVQADEAAALLDECSKAARTALILETFDQVGLNDPRRVYGSYPHQLSGGMLQRVLIALAIIPKPMLIVADEPTSALDMTVQKRILSLLSRLQTERGIGLLLITHDLAIAAERTGSVVVLKDGVVQEAGNTEAVFDSPRSAYARKLHGDVPALNPERYSTLRSVGFRRMEAGDRQAPKIAVSAVTKTFVVDGNAVTAVDNVSFTVAAGTTHALVGESGSGKTTTIRLLLGLDEADRGAISVGGEPVTPRSHRSMRAVRRHLQLVYQNPFTSLDPTWRVDALVREPLDRFKVGTRSERDIRAREVLASVGLDERFRTHRPDALSGGQRQRVAIARALILKPDVIVFDEPTSALDVSVQADIANVLLSLQAELGLTYLFVSHDLALVRQLAHTASVMQHGRIVEQGTVAEIFGSPQNDYTASLLDSIPSPNPLSPAHEVDHRF